MNYKYIAFHYELNGKVTIQKKKEKYVLSTDDTRVQSPKVEPTSY